mgnify:CR=1 FL=1
MSGIIVECAFCGEVYEFADYDLEQCAHVASERRLTFQADVYLPEEWSLLDSGEAYCPDCSKKFDLYDSPRAYGACKRCGAPLIDDKDEGQLLCRQCRRGG